MEDQVPDQIRNERSSRLMQLERRMSEEFRRDFVGERAEILYEEAKTLHGEVYQIGHTKRYIRVGKRVREDLKNRILEETLTEEFLDDMILVKDQAAAGCPDMGIKMSGNSLRIH